MIKILGVQEQEERYSGILGPIRCAYTPYDLPYKSFTFSGGEEHIALEDRLVFEKLVDFIDVIARITSSQELMQLLLIKDALDRYTQASKFRLFLYYIPYARQDRVCNKGEALSIKVLADLINSMSFDQVFVADAHSGVSTALINNCKEITMLDIVDSYEELRKRIGPSNIWLVAPDAGSSKKVFDVARYFNKGFVACEKVRDVSNGKILKTVVHFDGDDFKGCDVCILDDICDGGATFIALAQELKKKNCGKVILYVTHGIFSKGTVHLFNNGIDELWTTNSFREKYGLDNCFDLEKFDTRKI